MKKILLLLFVLTATVTASAQLHFIAKLDTKLNDCIIGIEYFDSEIDSVMHTEVFGRGRFNKFKVFNIEEKLTVYIEGVNEYGERLCKTILFNIQGEGLNTYLVTLEMRGNDVEVLCIDGDIKVLPMKKSPCP